MQVILYDDGLARSAAALCLRSYGFTDEELDFILNYDIKYRMWESGLELSSGKRLYKDVPVG